MTKEYLVKLILKPAWKMWYWYVSRKDTLGEVKFLNYGFDNDRKIELLEEDENERYPLQLYHHIISSIEINNKDILEVGCGRGGGSSYIARYFKPKSIKAVDISQKAIEYCKSNYASSMLEFIKADAQKLPFNDEAFDVVLNVESSHCYPVIENFFDEVYRVLRSGGYFLYADFRNKKSIISLKKSLINPKFETISKQDVTKEVIKALEIDDQRRVNLIKKFVPKFIHTPVGDFAGTKNSNTYKSFAAGWNEYFFYILKKN